MDRNPNFSGKISLIGHSLGSLIVFDLLSHQFSNSSEQAKTKQETKYQNLDEFLNELKMIELKSIFEKERIDINNIVIFYL